MKTYEALTVLLFPGLCTGLMFAESRAPIPGIESTPDSTLVISGAVPVQGPGIFLEITDSSKKPSSLDDAYYFTIHDAGLQRAVNALFSAGAEAISASKVESAKKLLTEGVPPREVAHNFGVSIPTLYRWCPASNRI